MYSGEALALYLNQFCTIAFNRKALYKGLWCLGETVDGDEIILAQRFQYGQDYVLGNLFPQTYRRE